MSRYATEFDWTDEAVERLRVMVADGYTGGQIAQAWNVTRNTICGKIKRLKLKRGEPTGLVKLAATVRQPSKRSRAKPPEEHKQRGRPKAPKERHTSLPTLAEMKAPRALPKDEPITETAVATIDLAAGQCKWPLNDGKPEWLHCGALAGDGPYCAHHAQRSRGAGTYSERVAA